MPRDRIGPWLAKKAMLEKLRVKHPVVFDVGAHFGNVTEYYLRMWDDVDIYCFEPEAAALAKLRSRFGKDKRVHIEPLALSDKRKVNPVSFFVGGQSGEMSSLLPRPFKGRRYYRHELRERQEVHVDSLDEYCEERELNFIHVLKLDVQGAELDVLKGASNHLTEGNISLIYTEILFVSQYQGGPDFYELWRYLRRYGYTLFDLYQLGRSKVSRQLVYGDALFVSPQVREKVIDQMPEEWLPKSKKEALGAPSP